MRYWVVGGEYTDTRFETAAKGEEERHGPFASVEDARRKWSELSMRWVDNALVRYRIERDGSTEYWVIGGRYTGTDFRTIAEGGNEERLGPFADYEEALRVWRDRAWATVDDSHARYRIEQR